MAEKSIWQQITNPRETYIDGYGQQREVYEPQWISTARNIYNKGENIYNKIDRRMNPGKYVELTDPETGEVFKPQINSGAGLLMDLWEPTRIIAVPKTVAKYRKWLKDKYNYDSSKFTDEQIVAALKDRFDRYKTGDTPVSFYGHNADKIETYKNGINLGYVNLTTLPEENNINYIKKLEKMEDYDVKAPYTALGYDAALKISDAQSKPLIHNHYILDPHNQIPQQRQVLTQTPVSATSYGTFATSDIEQVLIRKYINEGKTDKEIEDLLEGFILNAAKDSKNFEMPAAINGEYRAEITRFDFEDDFPLSDEDIKLQNRIRKVPGFHISKIDKVNTFQETPIVKHYFMSPKALENTIEPALDFDFQPTVDLYGYKQGGILKSHQDTKLPLYLQRFNYNK